MLLVAHIFASVQAAVTPWKGGGGQWVTAKGLENCEKILVQTSVDSKVMRSTAESLTMCLKTLESQEVLSTTASSQARSSKHDELSQLPRLGRMLS